MTQRPAIVQRSYVRTSHGGTSCGDGRAEGRKARCFMPILRVCLSSMRQATKAASQKANGAVNFSGHTGPSRRREQPRRASKRGRDEAAPAPHGSLPRRVVAAADAIQDAVVTHALADWPADSAAAAVRCLRRRRQPRDIDVRTRAALACNTQAAPALARCGIGLGAAAAEGHIIEAHSRRCVACKARSLHSQKRVRRVRSREQDKASAGGAWGSLRAATAEQAGSGWERWERRRCPPVRWERWERRCEGGPFAAHPARAGQADTKRPKRLSGAENAQARNQTHGHRLGARKSAIGAQRRRDNGGIRPLMDRTTQPESR